MRKSISRLGLLLALLLVVGACGSTVPTADRASPTGATGEFTESEAGTFADAGEAASGAGGATASRTSGSVAQAGSAARAGTVSSVAGPVSGPATGRGFTRTELYIGYTTWKDVSRFGATVGVEGTEPFDQELVAKAIVDDINARGGILGRKVVPVFYDYQTADLANPSAGDQAACTRFTEDRPVFAVVATVGPTTDVLPECLAKHKVPIIANDNIPRPQALFERLAPYFYATASPTMENFVRGVVPRAVANGWLGGWNTTTGQPGNAPVKVGLLVTDSPAGELFTKLVTDELKRAGVKDFVTFAASPIDASQMQAAVIQFAGQGVTHVVPEALNLLLFPQAAESQRYRPRYLASTASALLLVQATAPPQQMNGALGAGYFPPYDVDNAHDPGDVSPWEVHCREVQRKSGGNPDQRNAFVAMGKACDGFRFLEVALARSGLTPEGLRRATANLSFEPAGAFAVAFPGNRLDGVAAVRDIGYKVEDGAFYFLTRTNHPM